MVICTKDKFYIYDVAKMKLLHSLDTTSHLKARFCLSPKSTSFCYLAYSDEAGEGIVSLYDVKYLLPIDKIKAHKSAVIKMSISQEGTILVTSSGKGTLFRVFHLPEGGQMYTFKRGFSHAVIHSLSFGIEKLVCSSDSGTIHVFLMDKRVSGLTTGDATEETMLEG